MMIIKEGKEKEREIFVEQDWKKNALPTVMMIIKEGKKGERERERDICRAGLEEKCTPPKSSSRPPHCHGRGELHQKALVRLCMGDPVSSESYTAE